MPDRRDVLRQVEEIAARLANGLSLRTSLAGERLERTADRLSCALDNALRARRHRLDCLAGELNALSPLRVLDRGYALPTAPGGRVLRRRDDFVAGDTFDLRVVDGRVTARVEPT